MSSRNQGIDATKGIGIILVIAGHLFPYASFPSCVIFSFHMPLFFFLSGLFARPKQPLPFGAYVRKNLRAYLPMFLLFMLIGAAFTYIVPGAYGITKQSLLKELYLGTPEGIHVGQLWFLISLFEIKLAFWGADRLILSKQKLLYNILLLAAVLALVFTLRLYLPYLPYQRLPLRLDCSFMGFFFFLCGWFSRDVVLRLSEVKKARLLWVFIPCAVLTLVVSPVNGWVNIANIKYHNYALYFLFAFAGIAATVILGVCLSGFSILTFLGRNTLLIFSVHSLVNYMYSSALYILSRHTSTPWIQDGSMTIAAAAIGTVLVTACCGVIAVLYNRLFNNEKKL